MNMLPLRVVPLVSELPPDALVDRLRGVVGDGAAAPFAGRVTADGFVITRVNEFRSTALPRLRGRILAGPDGGARISLRLRPAGIVIAFMGVWIAFLAAFAAIVVVGHSRDPGRSLLPLLAPAGLGAFTWYLMAAVFDADARWAIGHLVAAVPALQPSGRAPGSGTCSP